MRALKIYFIGKFTHYLHAYGLLESVTDLNITMIISVLHFERAPGLSSILDQTFTLSFNEQLIDFTVFLYFILHSFITKQINLILLTNQPAPKKGMVNDSDLRNIHIIRNTYLSHRK